VLDDLIPGEALPCTRRDLAEAGVQLDRDVEPSPQDTGGVGGPREIRRDDPDGWGGTGDPSQRVGCRLRLSQTDLVERDVEVPLEPALQVVARAAVPPEQDLVGAHTPAAPCAEAAASDAGRSRSGSGISGQSRQSLSSP
jgi:hypothetical protein